MGVIMVTAIFLGIVTAILEFRLKFVGKIARKNKRAGLAASFGLSWLIALPFGVGGLIAFLGGLLSTVITDPVYAGQRQMEKADPRVKAALQDAKTTAKFVGKGVGVVGFGVVKLIGSPAAITRKVKEVRA